MDTGRGPRVARFHGRRHACPGLGAPPDYWEEAVAMTETAGEVKELIGGLKDEDRSVRARSAAELALLGPAAAEALPALADALMDEDRLVRTVVAEAIRSIGAPER